MSEEQILNGRVKLGRNQAIACVGFGGTLIMSYGLVWAGKLTGPEWIGFAQLFVPIAMGTILGVAGAVKGIQALAHKKAS